MVRLFSLALLGFAALPTVLSKLPSLDYNVLKNNKIRGVNLGGWLVLEPWITPSLFDNTGNDAIIDEYTFGKMQDSEEAKQALKDHWDTWITEQDFQEIAAAGLNLVRIPIGYWAYDNDHAPYISGQDAYLRKAVKWADKYNINVLIDLHGAPGSQNGFDNSGQKVDFPLWQTKQSYYDRTVAVVRQITEAYKDEPAVIGVAPLNEPAGFKDNKITLQAKRLWRDSYDIIRNQEKTKLGVVIHDAFQPTSSWQGFLGSGEAQGVLLDTHVYQVFSPEENARSDQEHIDVACANSDDIKDSNPTVVVGEWTPGSTDCAKYLNGRGVGARYDGTYDKNVKGIGSCKGKTGKGWQLDDDYKVFLRKFWEAQTSSYEMAGGWIQWTWKTEEAHEWAYQAGLQYGWIPYNPAERKYPGICGKKGVF